MDEVNKQELYRLIGDQFVQVFRLMGRVESVDCRDEWWSLITHLPHPFANFGILSKASDLDSLNQLAGLLAEVNQPAGIMLPGVETDEIRTVLEPYGFLMAEQMPAMWIPLYEWSDPSCPDGFSMRAIDIEQEGDTWVEAMCEGYEIPTPVGAMFGHQELPEGMAVEHFAVFNDDQMVATSMSFHDGTMGGVYCVATRKEFRRRGLGEAVTGLAVSALRNTGASMAVLQASLVGAPVYERMGFKSVGTLPLYVRIPESPPT